MILYILTFTFPESRWEDKYGKINIKISRDCDNEMWYNITYIPSLFFYFCVLCLFFFNYFGSPVKTLFCFQTVRSRDAYCRTQYFVSSPEFLLC
jgi:hypothetical protein